MNEYEMREKLNSGHILLQEMHINDYEIKITEKLIKEGFAVATGWTHKNKGQPPRRYVSKAGTPTRKV